MAPNVVVGDDEKSKLAEIGEYMPHDRNAYEETHLNGQIQGDPSTATLGVAIAVTSHPNAVGIGRDRTTWPLLASTRVLGGCRNDGWKRWEERRTCERR